MADTGVKKENDERERLPLRLAPPLIVLEQWICLVLGLVCIASGIRGICMKLSRTTLPAHLAWLGPGYVPTLRATAVVCLVMGGVLIRRGLTRP